MLYMEEFKEIETRVVAFLERFESDNSKDMHHLKDALGVTKTAFLQEKGSLSMLQILAAAADSIKLSSKVTDFIDKSERDRVRGLN